MLRAYRYRAYPTRREKQILNRQMFLAKEVYNLLLEKGKGFYKKTGNPFTKYQMNCCIKELKEERPEFNEVYSQVLQNVADRISKAYGNFFRRVKERKAGKKVKAGFPRQKRYVSSLTYPQFGFLLGKKYADFSMIGRVPFVMDREPDGEVKTLTIKKEKSQDWHVTVAIFTGEVPFVPNNRPKVGLDLGITSYAVLSDGTKIDNQRVQDKALEKLNMLHRRLSRKTKGGRNRRKAAITLAGFSEHLANQRSDNLHKLSHNLVNSYSLIAYEKLNIAGMVSRHCLAKTIYDASWSAFLKMLCYKAESAGCRVAGVDPKDTSKTCSRCGKTKEMPLCERTYVCDSCGLVVDRDLNASMNILARATAGHAGSYASGEITSTSAEKAAASGLVEPGTICGKAAGNT